MTAETARHVSVRETAAAYALLVRCATDFNDKWSILWEKKKKNKVNFYIKYYYLHLLERK